MNQHMKCFAFGKVETRSTGICPPVSRIKCGLGPGHLYISSVLG